MLSPAEWDALGLSARVAAWATVASLPFGVWIGWLLARRDFRGKFVLETLVQLPMVVPPVVPGYLLLWLLGPGGALGGWLESRLGLSVAFSWKGAVIARRLALERVPHGGPAAGDAGRARGRRAVLLAQPR